MIEVRYIGDEPREVSILPHGELKLVQPDATFPVPEQFAESYACQPHFFDVPGYAGPIEPPAVEVTLDGEQTDAADKPVDTKGA